MTLTRRARGAWPIVGAVIALAAVQPAALQQLPQPPASVSRGVAVAPAAQTERGHRISGRIASSDGRQLLSGVVILTPLDSDGVQVVPPEDVRINADGTFSFEHVPPGRYRIRARGVTTVNGPPLFASFGVVVEGREVESVQLILRPGATLSGELIRDAERATRAPVLSTLRVRAPFASGDFGDPLTAAVRPDGRFELAGLMPGEHQIVVEGLPSPWVVKSVLLRGREIADLGFETGERQHLRGARITITDQSSVLTGRVRDGTGPVRDAVVLVYSGSPQYWVRTHRRMRMARTDVEGRFSISGLPEGDYLAIASSAIDERDLGRRERLESIRKVSTPFRISGPDARVTIDLPFLASLPGAPVPTR